MKQIKNYLKLQVTADHQVTFFALLLMLFMIKFTKILKKKVTKKVLFFIIY